jgi:hypothetical protein
MKHYTRLRRGLDPEEPSRDDLSVEERFLAKLAPQDPVTGCIEWTGTKNMDGYGLIKVEGTRVLTHRLAYELKHGPIPKGKCVCHHCDNPTCCNDDHHFLGTHAGNMADMMTKGRQSKGESHGKAKLTEADVLEIRRRLSAGELQSVLAKDFEVSPAHVSMIQSGKTWSHLE